MKTVIIALSLAISGVAISAAYSDAYASRMNGKGSMCSDGAGCHAAKYKNATKAHVAKPKKTGH
jgi:hypothetical protein